jgi:peptidoglycan/xylan/chitin deacetylase (PgdA/CDA1 family)
MPSSTKLKVWNMTNTHATPGQAGPDLPPWAWPDDTWRAHVDKVRAGRSLRADHWPAGARAAVALSFDVDNETIPLRDGNTSAGLLAAGQFGARRGVERVLRLLDEHRVHATFFIPAVSALIAPGSARAIADAGHEVAAHGWIHERNLLLEAQDERELMFRALDVLEEITRQRPRGVRTPSGDFSLATLDIIREAGLVYDSSLMADDHPYELVADGEATGIVEIPIEWIRDDAPYFNMDRYGSARPYLSPRDWLQIQVDEFDAAYAEGGVYQLICHPHIIGHRSRMTCLSELMRHIASHSDVWFTTHGDLADHLLTPHTQHIERSAS